MNAFKRFLAAIIKYVPQAPYAPQAPYDAPQIHLHSYTSN